MKYCFEQKEGFGTEEALSRLGLLGSTVEARPASPEEAEALEFDQAIVVEDPDNRYLRRVLVKICEAMQTPYDIDIDEDEEAVTVNLAGDELGSLIGKKGTTLEATEILLSIIVNKNSIEKKRLFLDINSYRDKRREYLKDLASRLAVRAIERNEEVELEPMAPRDRRIIHLTLQDFAGVVTESEGEGFDRRVIIKPVAEE